MIDLRTTGSLPILQAGSSPASNMGAHAAAAKHHEIAAERHRKAINYHGDGNMEQAAQCSKIALQHGKQANQQAEKADRQYTG